MPQQLVEGLGGAKFAGNKPSEVAKIKHTEEGAERLMRTRLVRGGVVIGNVETFHHAPRRGRRKLTVHGLKSIAVEKTVTDFQRSQICSTKLEER